jgi:hypothetical protein
MFGLSKHLISCVCTGAILASAAGCGGASQQAAPEDPVKVEEAKNRATEAAKRATEKAKEQQQSGPPGGRPTGPPGGRPTGPPQ